MRRGREGEEDEGGREELPSKYFYRVPMKT